ncbi:hypothetical protein KKC32_00305 [Patescibacteria group bacterium]|nr:hypothetical protein [Patescibacteria group bacterium]
MSKKEKQLRYSPERVKEIRNALKALGDSFPYGEKTLRFASVGIEKSLPIIWQNEGRAILPNPTSMLKLFRLSGNDVFILRPEELPVWNSLNAQNQVPPEMAELSRQLQKNENPPEVVELSRHLRKKENPPEEKADDNGKPTSKRAYSRERLTGIAEAVDSWYKIQPEKTKLAKRLGTTLEALRRFRMAPAVRPANMSKFVGPSPELMWRFYRESGNEVFILSEEELKNFSARRGIRIPPEMISLVEERSSSEKKEVAAETEIPSETADAVVPCEPIAEEVSAEPEIPSETVPAVVSDEPDVGEREKREIHCAVSVSLERREPEKLVDKSEINALKQELSVLAGQMKLLVGFFLGDISEDVLEIEPTQRERVLTRILIGVTSSLNAVEPLLTKEQSLSGDLKRKAIDLIVRTIQIFGIRVSDFESLRPKAETDPKLLKSMEVLMGRAFSGKAGGQEP